MKSNEGFRRLRTDIIPLNYDLEVFPEFESYKFKGRVTIDLKVSLETESIELYSNGLNLSSIFYNVPGAENFHFNRIEKLEEEEIVIIYFENKIPSGIGKLTIEFNGILSDTLQGFYKTKCLNRDGSLGVAAVTQFEATYARKAFPCWDEPQFKSTFDITIIAEKDKTVLSNMPIKQIEEYHEDNRFSKFYFERTPIMSTYLVAYVIGNYDCVEKLESENNTLVRVFAPVGKSHLGQFSLDLTVKALQFYTKYFGLKYPLPKLDLIGLGDVEIEAMENWGLITFKESLVLLDQNKYSVRSKCEIALVVRIEYLSVDHIFPDHLLRAFELDSLISSHPIEVHVEKTSELFQIFDSISYCKGSSIIRMLNDFIGSKDFVQGLHNYLIKYQYKNATTNDLFTELELASKKEVRKLMQVWTKTTGYPVVNVSKIINDKGETVLTLNQDRFLKNSIESNNKTVLWNIPITIKTKSSTITRFLMKEKYTEINLGRLDKNDWIKLNSDNIGFYRVNYLNNLFDELLYHLENELVDFGTALDRFQLVSDAFALAWCGSLKISNLLQLVWCFRNETDTYVWIILIENLKSLSGCLLYTSFYEEYKLFMKKLIEKITKKLGYHIKNEEDDLTRLLKENILYILAKTDDEDFQRFSNSLVNEYSFLADVQSDLQKPVFTSLLRNGNMETVLKFISIYDKSETPEEKERIALMLAEVINDDLINYVLEFSISPKVTYEETVFLIVAISKNPTNKNSLNLAWNFVKKNWSTIISRYNDSVLLGRLLKPLIQNFKTEIEINDALVNQAPQAELMIKQAIELANSNVHFLKQQENNIETFLVEFL